MTKIITLFFILLSFCLSAQVNNLDVKALQDEISRCEKAGDNYSNEIKEDNVMLTVPKINNIEQYQQHLKEFILF